MARSASRDEGCTLPGCKSGDTDWKDANITGEGTHHTHAKEGWRGENVRINTSDLPHENSCQNIDECLGQMTLQKPRAKVGFQGLAGRFLAWLIHTATDFTLHQRVARRKTKSRHNLCHRVVPGHRNHLNDPASEFLSTHWWSQNPVCQRCLYKPLKNCHSASEFLHSP